MGATLYASGATFVDTSVAPDQHPLQTGEPRDHREDRPDGVQLDAARPAGGTGLTSITRQFEEADTEDAKLDPAEFEAAVDVGRGMTATQAVEYALGGSTAAIATIGAQP